MQVINSQHTLNLDPSESRVLEELDAYDRPAYVLPEQLSFPLGDEPQIAAWSHYASLAQQIGAYSALQRHFVQLQFPIAENMSQDPAYLAATRRGAPVSGMPGLALECPGKVRLFLHGGLAGQIPVIYTPHKGDFHQLIRAFRFKNEPVALPDSIGAMLIGGYNNWERIRQYRQQWQETLAGSASESDWEAEFLRLIKNPALYQDSFIILSRGNYSNLPASMLGFYEENWLQDSFSIRLIHEYTHYLTKRVFGFLRTHVVDELLADYAGLIGTYGQFKQMYFLKFMGLESYPKVRPNGRLSYYRKNLSDAAFDMLKKALIQAADRLEKVTPQPEKPCLGWQTAVTVLSIAPLSLSELAGPHGDALLEKSQKVILNLVGDTYEQPNLSKDCLRSHILPRAA